LNTVLVSAISASAPAVLPSKCMTNGRPRLELQV
jgi:hypothetical protein